MKQWFKRLLCRPFGVAMGAGSIVAWPRKLRNRDRITMGVDCRIGPYVVFNPLRHYGSMPLPGHIVLGDDVYIGGFTQIHAMDRIEVGEGCVLSEHVYVSDIAHGVDPQAGPIMAQPLESHGPVVIGKRVFIGYGCSVLPGVKLGDHCVVGTRSVVTRSFPAYSMVAGVPARLIKTYHPASGQWRAPA